MRRTTVATNATASAFQAAALLLVGAGALLILAHTIVHGGAAPQDISLYLQAP